MNIKGVICWNVKNTNNTYMTNTHKHSQSCLTDTETLSWISNTCKPWRKTQTIISSKHVPRNTWMMFKWVLLNSCILHSWAICKYIMAVEYPKFTAVVTLLFSLWSLHTIARGWTKQDKPNKQHVLPRQIERVNLPVSELRVLMLVKHKRSMNHLTWLPKNLNLHWTEKNQPGDVNTRHPNNRLYAIYHPVGPKHTCLHHCINVVPICIQPWWSNTIDLGGCKVELFEFSAHAGQWKKADMHAMPQMCVPAGCIAACERAQLRCVWAKLLCLWMCVNRSTQIYPNCMPVCFGFCVYLLSSMHPCMHFLHAWHATCMLVSMLCFPFLAHPPVGSEPRGGSESVHANSHAYTHVRRVVSHKCWHEWIHPYMRPSFFCTHIRNVLILKS